MFDPRKTGKELPSLAKTVIDSLEKVNNINFEDKNPEYKKCYPENIMESWKKLSFYCKTMNGERIERIDQQADDQIVLKMKECEDKRIGFFVQENSDEEVFFYIYAFFLSWKEFDYHGSTSYL